MQVTGEFVFLSLCLCSADAPLCSRLVMDLGNPGSTAVASASNHHPQTGPRPISRPLGLSQRATMVACYRTAEAEPPEVDGTRFVPPIAARRPTSKRRGLVRGNDPQLPGLATRFHRIRLSPTSPVHHKVALLTLTHVDLYRPPYARPPPQPPDTAPSAGIVNRD